MPRGAVTLAAGTFAGQLAVAPEQEAKKSCPCGFGATTTGPEVPERVPVVTVTLWAPAAGAAEVLVVLSSDAAPYRKAAAALNTEVFSQPGLGAAELRSTVEAFTALRSRAGDFAAPPGAP